MRFGRFVIARHVIDSTPELVRAVWAGLIPVDVRMSYVRDGFECVAIGPAFADVDNGMVIPEYRARLRLGKAGEYIFDGWDPL